MSLATGKGKKLEIEFWPAQILLIFNVFTQGKRQRSIFCFCIWDTNWRDSRLPWLDKVLSWLDGVGLKGVSWAVRYLEKPQWRAEFIWEGVQT